MKDTPTFHAQCFPKSSRAAGRNKLLDMVVAQEKKQGWKFDYLLYYDDSIRSLVMIDREKYKVNSRAEGRSRV